MIGFDRFIKLEWLDAIAGRMQSTGDVDKLREYLHIYLEKEHPNYEARRKTITVLLKIWVFMPSEHAELRDRAIKLLADMDSKERIWLHWGMILLAYPFFKETASTISRLLSLQGEFTIPQVNRKMIEAWGQRTTLPRAIGRVIQSMQEWEVIKEKGVKGTYVASSKLSTSSQDLELWFLEAVLKAEDTDFAPLEQIYKMPSAFPFSINTPISVLLDSKKFEISQQGLNRSMISVK
jgi:hypothetical protein